MGLGFRVQGLGFTIKAPRTIWGFLREGLGFEGSGLGFHFEGPGASEKTEQCISQGKGGRHGLRLPKP